MFEMNSKKGSEIVSKHFDINELTSMISSDKPIKAMQLF